MDVFFYSARGKVSKFYPLLGVVSGVRIWLGIVLMLLWPQTNTYPRLKMGVFFTKRECKIFKISPPCTGGFRVRIWLGIFMVVL